MTFRLAPIVPFLLAACGEATTPLSTVPASTEAAVSKMHAPTEETIPGRWYAQSAVVAGEPLYQTHCAVCHAADGSATEDWRSVDENGNFPPPPLNGTAHTWHHPMEVLDDTIANGGAQYGGIMPGFGAVLDAEERRAIVAYIQSWWTDEIYNKWAEIDAR